MAETKSSEVICTRLRRIAKQSREHPEWVLTTLAHHIDLSWLKEAHSRTRKDGAVGVDGLTAAEYAEDLEGNLQRLLDRFKSGLYRAPPVRRVYIPKADGRKQRAIGIPTFEDKILQRAVAMVLGAVYEEDFLDCSYGFRPGRSQHQALSRLRDGLMSMGGGWVLELDIEQFFDALDQRQLRSFLDGRVRDGVLRRVIHKWLKAGVLEEGSVRHPETGTPQGGVISPILANIYLHEVLDRWFEHQVKPRLRGRAFLVRYADDAVLALSHQEDARRVLAALPKRFAKYGLRLHPDKTRIVAFRRPRRDPEDPAGGPPRRPESFNMLGFTHYWARSRRGRWVVKQKTACDRLARAVRRMWRWCRDHRHLPLAVQQQALCSKLRGHYQYYGVIGNHAALERFYRATSRAWRQWLNRRSHAGRRSWDWFNALLERLPLLRPCVTHGGYRR